MELEKLPMPINPRAACRQNGRLADKSTNRQCANPCRFMSRVLPKLHRFTGEQTKSLVFFFDLYRQF